MSPDQDDVDTSTSDSAELDQQSAEAGVQSAKTRTGWRGGSPLRRVLLLIGLVLIPVAAWRLYGDRQYWSAAWSQGTVFPKDRLGGDWGEPFGEQAQLAQLQQDPREVFDLKAATVPAGEIRSGGPPKDGIPALTNPKLIDAADASYLQADDRVIGVVIDSEPRAYPLKILNFHEIVNDRIGKSPFAVTYCPLCDSAAVFDRRTPLGEREFGVSGLLYNSNVLMYDRGGRPESLWSQVKTEGISGPAAGKSLAALPLELTTWQDWLARHPQTTVLSTETGHSRNYQRSPYSGYFTSPELMFPARPTSNRLPTKAPVLGVWTKGAARAYPASNFGREARELKETLDGKNLTLAFNPDANSLRVVAADEGVSWMYSLWFAWYALRPQTEVFEGELKK